MAMLVCAKCETSKPSGEFTNGEQRRLGYRRCRACVAEYNREHNKRRPPRVLTEEQKERQREAGRRKDPARVADYWFRYRYGLTLVQVEAMAEEQGGLCAVCCQPETKTDPRTGKVRRLSVDHNHRTGQPRQLLCLRCNQALGLVDDDQQLLERMVAYLDRHRADAPQTFERV